MRPGHLRGRSIADCFATLIETHANGWQLVAGAELRGPHRGQSLWLQNAIPVEFSAIEQGLPETAHICGGRGNPSRRHGLKISKPMGGFLCLSGNPPTVTSAGRFVEADRKLSATFSAA